MPKQFNLCWKYSVEISYKTCAGMPTQQRKRDEQVVR